MMVDINREIKHFEENVNKQRYHPANLAAAEVSIYFTTRGDIKSAKEWAAKSGEMADLAVTLNKPCKLPPSFEYPKPYLAYWLAGMQKEFDRLIERSYPLMKKEMDDALEEAYGGMYAPHLVYALYSDKKKAEAFLRQGAKNLELRIAHPPEYTQVVSEPVKPPTFYELIGAAYLCVTYFALKDEKNTRKWLKEFRRMWQLKGTQSDDEHEEFLRRYAERLCTVIAALLSQDKTALRKAADELLRVNVGPMGQDRAINALYLLEQAYTALGMSEPELRQYLAGDMLKDYR